jgi:hypothetical protein
VWYGGVMKTQEKKLPIVNSSETKALPTKKENNRYEPLTDREIKEIRINPIASYLDVVRLTNLYDETRKDLLKVQHLSSMHYQHHSDTMKILWEANKDIKKKNKEIEDKSKQLDDIDALLKEAIEKEEEANKSREFMCGEAGKQNNIKNKILDYINSSNVIYTYDSVTEKNDTIIKFSKIEFEKFLDLLEEEEEDCS